MKDPRDIIIAPGRDREVLRLLEGNVYTFKVHPDANKLEIHDAVEAIFGVKVTKVNTLNRKGKRKRNRRTFTFGSAPTPSGRSSPSPRATTIELFEG